MTGDDAYADATPLAGLLNPDTKTVAGAARDYGVAILGERDTDPEGLAIDEAATAGIRAARAAGAAT